MNEYQRQVQKYMNEALKEEDCHIREAWEAVENFVMSSLVDVVFDQHSVEIGDVVECTNGLMYKILAKGEIGCTMQFMENDMVNPNLTYKGIPYNVIKTIKR